MRKIRAGARSSPLSRAQLREIQTLLGELCLLDPVYVETTGDLDKKTSLRTLGKTDFFTKELDALLLEGNIEIAIHSAKDLPDPLPQGLQVIALTKGLDPRDSLVIRERLPNPALIATSCRRREEMVRVLYPFHALSFIDLRGTIEERLALLDQGKCDGVVIAEAALIRLNLSGRDRIILPGETPPGQGRLAIVSRMGDIEMAEIFQSLHYP